ARPALKRKTVGGCGEANRANSLPPSKAAPSPHLSRPTGSLALFREMFGPAAVERLGMHTRLTPLGFAAASFSCPSVRSIAYIARSGGSHGSAKCDRASGPNGKHRCPAAGTESATATTGVCSDQGL